MTSTRSRACFPEAAGRRDYRWGWRDGRPRARSHGPAGGRGDGSPVFDGRGNTTAESLHMEIPKATMARLASLLTSMVDRPVVDRTGLTGTYEIGFDVPSRRASIQSSASLGTTLLGGGLVNAPSRHKRIRRSPRASKRPVAASRDFNTRGGQKNSWHRHWAPSMSSTAPPRSSEPSETG